MLRRLFISLLILSALTAEGIINITEFLCDPSLLTKEVIDFVLSYEGEFTAKQVQCLNKNGGLKASSAFFSSIKLSDESLKFHSNTTDIKSWFAVNSKSTKLVLFLTFLFVIFIAVQEIINKGIVFYHSDLSPPYCYN
ncbi:MAG TPA: hypothetical protein PK604_00010 [Acetivibrio clariflavus]|nr:hypothetical protein [Acetivibrio clariflavus]HPU42550.1 hypothetical protein [Acetivibrio clariflavus]